MEVVIRISDKDYNAVCNGKYIFNWQNFIRNGIILPKGHGRLVDEYDVMESYRMGEYDLNDCPTIVEADEEEDE